MIAQRLVGVGVEVRVVFVIVVIAVILCFRRKLQQEHLQLAKHLP